jgi:two-component system KDP operon response regulator KdpE
VILEREKDLSDLIHQPVILIIEDDESIRDIVSRVLEEEGFLTHTAVNGLKGLEQFYVTLPDLILLDVKMPEMDGWETLQRLREVSQTPVIMLTVFGSTDDILRGLELGADDYLVKPFGIKELIVRVKAVLRRSSPV